MKIQRLLSHKFTENKELRFKLDRRKNLKLTSQSGNANGFLRDG